jgi:hypothetical protein
MSLGNDLPVTITLRTTHGADLTGRTVSAFLSLTEGGAAISGTTVTLTEDTTTATTARVYRGEIDATVVDTVIALGGSYFYLCITDPDDFKLWEKVPVVRYRRAA